MNKKLGFISLFGSAFIYAFLGILMRYASLSFGAFSQVALRGLVGFIFLIFLLIIQNKKFYISPKIDLKRLVFYLPTAAFSIACATFSINMIKASNTIFYIYAGVLTSSLLYGVILYKEKITPIKVICLTLAIIGIFFLAYPLQKVTILGAILGIIPGFLDSTENAMIKYLGKFEKTSLMTLQNATTFILGVIMFFIFSEALPVKILPISVMSIIGMGLAMVGIISLYFYGFKNFDLNLGNIVTSVELILILFLNAVFLHEFPNTNEIVGGTFIFVSILIISINAFKTEKTTLSASGYAVENQ